MSQDKTRDGKTPAAREAVRQQALEKIRAGRRKRMLYLDLSEVGLLECVIKTRADREAERLIRLTSQRLEKQQGRAHKDFTIAKTKRRTRRDFGRSR